MSARATHDFARATPGALKAVVMVTATTLNGHPFAWTAEGSSPTGNVHEALSRVAAGFLPRPAIAQHLRAREEQMIERLASGVAELEFRVGAYDCRLANDLSEGTSLSWRIASSGTRSILAVSTTGAPGPMPPGGFAELIELTVSPVQPSRDGGPEEIEICLPEPWRLDHVAFITGERS